MNLIININLDNAAFEDDSEAELENIFWQIASEMDFPRATLLSRARDHYKYTVRDTNGNTVGNLEVTE